MKDPFAFSLLRASAGWKGVPSLGLAVRKMGRAVLVSGLCRTLAILCLILAATAIVSPAQNDPDSVKFSNLFNFDATDGGAPAGGLVQGTDGNFYGTTFSGGTKTTCSGSGCGTFFRITPGGTLTTLYSFCSQTNCADGGFPSGALLLGTDANFYGITEWGGSAGGSTGFGGTVFKITSSGTLTTLYNWCSQPNCADGSYIFLTEPNTLVEATNGNFYGTNDGGGNASGAGTFFELTPSGSLTTLYTFCSQSDCADGATPFGLIQATDGNFYGTTASGGADGGGTVFKITPSGALTTLHNFCSQGGSACTDGGSPFAPLIQGTNGDFYGTTTYRGNGAACLPYQGCGTVFEITPSGTLTTLYNFCSETNCTDGSDPAFALVQATDGNFYGSTGGGRGSSNCSSYASPDCWLVYKLSPRGALTTLHSFDLTDGAGPNGLVQATNGTFYGTAMNGGPSSSSSSCFGGCGTVFSVSGRLRPFVETVPIRGNVGEPVTILGNHLTDATHVRFNRTEAEFKVMSESEIQTTVPAGATTGFVTVEKSGLIILNSNVQFQVRP